MPGAYVPNTTYTIVNTSQGVTGTFSGVTEDFACITPTLSYDANNVYLSLVLLPNAFRSVGQTVNQQAVGSGLDAIVGSGNLGASSRRWPASARRAAAAGVESEALCRRRHRQHSRRPALHECRRLPDGGRTRRRRWLAQGRGAG